jgi:hypothetical protein
MKAYKLIYLSLFLVFPCQVDKKRNDVSKLVAEWQGKEVVFSDNIVFTRYLTDTTDYRIPDSEYKISMQIPPAVPPANYNCQNGKS